MCLVAWHLPVRCWICDATKLLAQVVVVLEETPVGILEKGQLLNEYLHVQY